ncbi:hypothetical protein F5Y15DRAFT_146543 [Xylariaceae sp. FL0016]|nr:hypothetical protein F5Y15DRAFT_146543 [Xylariaceae sp. FL0016]
MFRDESSKVIQKAHAQWGGPSGSPIEGDPGSSGSSPTSSTAWTPTTPSADIDNKPPAPRGQTPAAHAAARQIVSTRVPRRVEPSLEQRGLQFYIDRYLMNHPDSPRSSNELADYCGSADATQNVMIAVGLAGMSNLLGNKSMNVVARTKYVTALKQTGQLIATNSGNQFADIATSLRSIVTLALFEVVQGKGSRITAGSANTHIHGAVALLRSVLPVPHAPSGGARGVLQLMFSMFIPSQMTDTPLPPGFFECLKLCKELLESSPEACCVDLAMAIARLLQLLAMAEQPGFIDDQPNTNDMIQQTLIMEGVFASLEAQLQEAYPFLLNKGLFSPKALFHGQWHTYNEIWGARIWNHFRWARILLNQMIIKFTADFHNSSDRYISEHQREQCYTVMRRMAEDILTSVPSHWHHPVLDITTARRFEASGQGGSGAAGLPSLLWHITIAGCAPQVPPDLWDWAHDVLQVVWKDMGMQHALALSEVMEEHKAKVEKEAARALSPLAKDREPVVVKVEED